MSRKITLAHCWLYNKCLMRTLKERIFEGKHKNKITENIVFYHKGMLRSLGITDSDGKDGG